MSSIQCMSSSNCHWSTRFGGAYRGKRDPNKEPWFYDDSSSWIRAIPQWRNGKYFGNSVRTQTVQNASSSFPPKQYRTVFFRVLLNRSTWALAAGQRGVILLCLLPNCLHHAVNSSDPKGTLSDVMTTGKPCVVNI